jgi:hypothetical protein
MGLFKASDYQSIEIRVQFQNLTSGLPIRKRQLSVDWSEFKQMELVEFGMHQKVVFNLPKESCAVGHHLAIGLEFQAPGQPLRQVSITARVVSIEEDSVYRSRVSVQLLQYVQEDWEILVSAVIHRQYQIHEFMQRARGEVI